MSHNFDKALEHQYRKGQQMQTCQCLRQALVVSRQTTEPRRSAETALHDPTPRQQHTAFFCLWQLHRFQANAVLLGSLSRRLASVSLIDKSDFHLLGCRLLDLRA